MRKQDMVRSPLSALAGLIWLTAIGCTSSKMVVPRATRAAITPMPLSTSTPAPTPSRPTPISRPTAVPAAVATISPSLTAVFQLTPGVTYPIDCAEVHPFAPGCLDQPRPDTLAPGVPFVGVIPSGHVAVAAWSPDGTRLAYAVASRERSAWQGVEVRRTPDFALDGRWAAPGISDLTWTPDSRAVLFVFDRGDTSSIGLAQVGQTDWRDLLPGERAMLAVSLGKRFVGWLNERMLIFRVHCGTGCEALYGLDIVADEPIPLVNCPSAPYANVFATRYFFSPDHRWLAATDWGTGLPRALVLEWPGPAKSLDLSELVGTSYTEAQSWAGGSLAFVAYPPGGPDAWPSPPRPDLHVWNADSGGTHHVASGAFHAVFAPTGDRLAILLIGRPSVNEEGQIGSDASAPHLGLLSWPGGRLLATHPISTKGLSDVFDLWRLPVPTWSPDGRMVAFQPAGGGLALMDRNGHARPMLVGKLADWVGWGAEDYLALLVDETLWLVRSGPALAAVKQMGSVTAMAPTPEPTPTETAEKLTITILYDNNPYDERLKTAWGFSCLVEQGDLSLLFDTGADAPTLLSNMAVLGLDPAVVDIIVLSHIHGDHIGGLEGILDRNKGTTVYLPRSFPASVKGGIRPRARVVEVREPMEIARGVYTTGELGSGIVEQSLALATGRGLVVITGCAHPGVVKIVAKVKEMSGGDIYLVMGGFHLGGASEAAIEGVVEGLRQLGVQRVAPCHCSGDRARGAFQKVYGENFILAGVGRRLEIR